MKIIVLVGLLLLQGCSVASVWQSCKRGDACVSYASVTEGEASGIYSVVTGSLAPCKVTTFGDVGAWAVTYNGEKCHAELNGGVDATPDN